MAAAGQRLLAVADAGIDRSRISSEVLQRIRLVHLATGALVLIGVPYVFRYWSLGISWLAVAVAAAIVAALGNLWLIRRTLKPTPGAHLALAIYHVLLVFVVGASGGFYDPIFAWFYTVPIAAAAVLDLKGAWIWSGITLATCIGFWLAPDLGLVLPNLVPPEQLAEQSLLNRLTALLALSCVASGFVVGQRRAEQELGTANDSLTREKRYVELLQLAAVSANEASSLEDALRRGLEGVCHAMGWPAGHVFLENEAGQMEASGIYFSADFDHYDPVWQHTLKHARFSPGEGNPGLAWATKRPVAVYDLLAHGSERALLAAQLGIGAVFDVPVVAGGRVAAVMEICAPERLAPDDHLLEVLGHMGEQLGRVVSRKALQDRLRQSQKLEAVGQLAAGLAHEINNPMAYVKTNLNMLRDAWTRLSKSAAVDAVQEVAVGLREELADCEELLDESLEGVTRTIEIVRDVRDFSRSAGGTRESAGLNDLLESAWRVVSPRVAKGVVCERRYGELPQVLCAPGQLRQVFVNLIVNAVQAVGEQGRVRLETRTRGDDVVVVVEDDGPGISPAHRARLFDPFFTTKPVGEGTGLGLYVSYQIAAAHGGEIRVSSTLGHGSRFEVHLPLDAEESTSA